MAGVMVPEPFEMTVSLTVAVAVVGEALPSVYVTVAS
jgi:hypothetical protein